MKVDAACGTAAVIVLFSLFTACSGVDIGTLYASSGSYRVKALVNGNSLEDCSILRSDDKIQPYFVVFVINDPDLAGLLVYLQNPRGEITGGKIRYVLQAYADEVNLPKTEAEIAENLKTTVINSENGEGIQKSEETTRVTSNEQLDFLEKLVIIPSFDKDLPHFSVPPKLEIGSYSLVFEALGRRSTLSHTETDIYYLGNIEFYLKDISLYLPGVPGSQLIQPESTVLLEASLDFDKRLDPYLIWYRGKTVVSEGRVSEGAGSLLWKAPEQAGIYPMRLEAFPFRLKQNLSGILREISLPVSPKAVNTSYFFADGSKYSAPPSVPELLQWYQFNGNLLDSTSTLTNERQLVSINNKRPHWAAVKQNYGLSIGLDDSYSVSPVNFIKAKHDQGGGIFLFHLRPITEGDIFSVFFPSQLSPTEGAQIHMTSENNNIVLHLGTNGKIVEASLHVTIPEAQAFIPVVVKFFIRPHAIEAKLSLGEDPLIQHEAMGIRLSGPLTGEGKIIIGTAPKGLKPLTSAESPQATNFSSTEGISAMAATGSVEQSSALTTVWNEFVVLLSETPLLPEELPATIDQYIMDSRPVTELSSGTVSLGGAVPSSDSRNDNTEAGSYLESELTDG
jgi:hypothetical protein